MVAFFSTGACNKTLRRINYLEKSIGSIAMTLAESFRFYKRYFIGFNIVVIYEMNNKSVASASYEWSARESRTVFRIESVNTRGCG